MQKKAKATLILTTLIIFTVIPLSSATISKNYNNLPRLDQWTTASLPEGNYSSMQRINGTWYVNGAVYPAAIVNTDIAPVSWQTGSTNNNPTVEPEPTPDGENQPTGSPHPTEQHGALDAKEAPWAFIGIAVFLTVLVLGSAGVATTKGKKKSKVQWKNY
jgi:hypothetical protein